MCTKFLQHIQERLELSRSGSKQGQNISIQQHTYKIRTNSRATLRGPILQPPLHAISNRPNSEGERALLNPPRAIKGGAQRGSTFDVIGACQYMLAIAPNIGPDTPRS
jgi:hypothetical protein